MAVMHIERGARLMVFSGVMVRKGAAQVASLAW